MKKYIYAVAGILALAFLTVNLKAAQSPFPPWVDELPVFQQQDPAGSAPNLPFALEAGSQEGIFGAKVARFIYDVSTDGGSIASHGTGVYLPANAVITRSYFKIITQFSDSGSGTVALSCEDANNIKTATDITGSSANAFVEGESDGTAANFKRGISARCEITATVATAAQDAGKLVGWVHYVVEP